MSQQPHHQYVNPGVSEPHHGNPPSQDPNYVPTGQPVQQHEQMYSQQPQQQQQFYADPYQQQQPQQQMYYDTVMIQQPAMTPYAQQYQSQPQNQQANTQMQCMSQTGSVAVDCPSCNKKTMTKTKCKCGDKIWLIACLLCLPILFGCPPCC
jgi:hypothetical protein